MNETRLVQQWVILVNMHNRVVEGWQYGRIYNTVGEGSPVWVTNPGLWDLYIPHNSEMLILTMDSDLGLGFMSPASDQCKIKGKAAVSFPVSHETYVYDSN